MSELSQKRFRRNRILVGCVVTLVLLLLFVVFGPYRGWPTDVEINFWVAVGTLLLALTTGVLSFFTFESVVLTQNLVNAEERRHRQAMAPILLMRPRIDGANKVVTGFEVRNVGLGPAMQVAITGEIAYERRPTLSGPTEPPIIDGRQIYTRPMINVFTTVVGTGSSEILPTGGSPNFFIPATGVGSSNITIKYSDMFGDPYETVLGHIWNPLSTWRPPTTLKFERTLEFEFDPKKK